MRFFPLSLLLALLFLHGVVHAADDAEQTRINIGKLQESMRLHEEKIAASGEEERSILQELERLDAAADKGKLKLKELQTKLEQQRAAIITKQEEFTALTAQHAQIQQHLIKRMRAFYLMGRTGMLNVAFASQSLSELVLSNEALRFLVTYDKELLTEYRRSMAAFYRAKKAQQEETAALQRLIAEEGTQQQTLERTVREKNQLLKQVKDQRSLYEQALKEMKKAERTLTNTLVETSKMEKSVPANPGFAKSKGKLPPPLRGEIIRQFKDPAAIGEEAAFANGITIRANDNAEVRAVYGGQVIYADYMQGYGKVVIIEHAQQYYTVTARFNEIRVKEGTRVEQGQVIGACGDSATLFGKGLYFEIRQGAVAQNPLDWLQPGAIIAP